MINNTVGVTTSDRMERLLMRLSLIGLLFCLLLLLEERAYQYFFGARLEDTGTPVIGHISFAKNDIRHRSSMSISWEKAQSEQKIRTGDSVFTGPSSQLQVQLKKGGRVLLDQKSLVRFSRADSIEVPNLALGNFRISVNGKLAVAIDGEVTEFEGDGSELQVVVKKNEKPKLRLLKGTALVIQGRQRRTLPQGQTVPAFIESEETPARGIATSVADLQLKPVTEIQVHLAEVYDLYEMRNLNLIPRSEIREVVHKHIPVAWEGLPANTVVYGQLSGGVDFKSVIDSFSTQDRSSVFKRSRRGRNFIRLSLDGKNWVNQEFQVQMETIPIQAPDLKFDRHRWDVLNQPVVARAEVESLFSNHLVEVSDDPEFSPRKTKVMWLSSRVFEMTLSDPQVVFVRLRGVNEKQQVTDPSRVQRIEVQRPSLPLAPRLAMNSREVFQNEELLLTWSDSRNAESYQIEITNEQGKTLLSQSTRTTSFQVPTMEAGRLFLKVTAKDRFGRSSVESARAEIAVKAGLPLSVATTQVLDSPHSPSVGPSLSPSVSALAQKISGMVPEFLNKNYRSSKLQIEGAAFTMFSQDQISSGEKNPTALMMGLRWLKWFGAQGLEGVLKSKLKDIQNSGDSEVSPLHVEARYRYRWNIPLSPFSKLGSSEFSLLGGYEYYKNSGRGLFSPGYSLVKSGFSLAFPLFHRWDMGGEVLYGLGTDTSHKYEISGYFNRYVDPQWSFGFGYRIHLFEAGSTATTAIGLLPYREGYGEGYSVIRWHY